MMWEPYPTCPPTSITYVCPCGIVPVGSHVISFITAQTIFKVSKDILSRPFASLNELHPLITSNPLWYARSWLTDTRLTDGILPILTSISVDRHVQSQVIKKIERTTSCVMTHRLTQPPTVLQLWWLPCHYCVIITTKVSSAPLCLPSLSIIKALLKQNKKEATLWVLSLSFSIHSQNLTWASEGVFGQPVWTSLCRKTKSLDSGTRTGIFAITSKREIHLQLIWYQQMTKN